MFVRWKFTGRLFKYTGVAMNGGNARKWYRLLKAGTTMNDHMLLPVHYNYSNSSRGKLSSMLHTVPT
jgi:hypothetical protein